MILIFFLITTFRDGKNNNEPANWGFEDDLTPDFSTDFDFILGSFNNF
jgi:hypothetical protein